MAGRTSKFEDFSHPLYDAHRSEEAAHILIIRLSAMGDVAMLVPVLRIVTTTYPSLRITLLTRGFFAPMFKDMPNIKVYQADLMGLHGGVVGLCRLARELKELEIDAVGDLHDVLRSNVLRYIFYFYGIPVKQIDKGRTEKNALTVENNKVFKQLKSTHERYAEVFSELGYPIHLGNAWFPEKSKLAANIQEITGDHTQKWIGIAPFAQHDSKVYPLDLMEMVIRELDHQGKTTIFLFGGGKSETEKLEKLAKDFTHVISIAGRFSFEEELALISNLDLMVAMDSANAHLAAIYGVAVITLWGVTHPYAGFSAFNQPWENNLLPDLTRYPKIPTSVYGNKFPEDYGDVMRTIPPQTVLNKIREVSR